MAKQKKPAKKVTSIPEYDSRREQNVLLDEMSKSIKSVAEGHSGIVKKLDKVESELGYIRTTVVENGRDIKKIETGQQELKQEVKEIKTKLYTVTSDHEKRLKKLEVV